MGTGFWRLWTSSGLSNLADGTFKVALPLVAIQTTREPTLIAGLVFALTLPWLVFALPAGALTDRLDRRRTMLRANAARAALLALLAAAVASGWANIWLLYAIAFAAGIAETLYDTSAQSLVPQLVDRDRLPRANARLFAVELTANEFAGPPVAGLLVAAGAVAAFTAPAALWLVALVALWSVRGAFKIHREHRTTLRADIAEGLRFLLRHRLLRSLAVVVGLFNTANTASGAVLVLHAVGPASAMGLSAQLFGLLLTTPAVGSLVGSLAAERVIAKLGRSRSLVVGFVAGTLLVAAPAVTTDPYVVAAAFAVAGGGIAVLNVVAVTLRQRVTPDRLLGRVNSAYRLVAWGTMPLGAALGGVLAQAFGLRAVFVIMTAVALVALLGLTAATERKIEQAMAG
ncbi:putative MFS family arabinose efflux permease [Saccharothrix carnea]|uniref:Putative MFS family arabinose efflux permease n=2 Tax=Saccharothrix carnea TaxID=1280637 RepID=A0A2P8IJ71_SACCR|nr:putative MFS family arabinose efflux permease [Saccharothrix carnea]